MCGALQSEGGIGVGLLVGFGRGGWLIPVRAPYISSGELQKGHKWPQMLELCYCMCYMGCGAIGACA